MENLNVKLEEKKEELVKIHKRDIFNIIENTNGENPTFTLTMGMYKIKDFDNLALADLYIDEKPYELLFAMMGIAMEIALKEFNNKQTKN